MSKQKILPCRICGSDAIRRDVGRVCWVETNCEHRVAGPTMPTPESAIEEWNKMMMQPQVFAEVESTGTSYRDRVDMMVAAILASEWGVHSNHIEIVNIAFLHVNAIDRELAKREGVE